MPWYEELFDLRLVESLLLHTDIKSSLLSLPGATGGLEIETCACCGAVAMCGIFSALSTPHYAPPSSPSRICSREPSHAASEHVSVPPLCDNLPHPHLHACGGGRGVLGMDFKTHIITDGEWTIREGGFTSRARAHK